MQSFAAIIDAFGGPGPFSQAVGVSDSHARTMKARGSIPVEYWQIAVEAAKRLGIEGLSLDLFVTLARLKAEERKVSPPAVDTQAGTDAAAAFQRPAAASAVSREAAE